MKNRGAAGRRGALRLVFGGTLLFIAVLQYAFLGIARGEPYPAVILPGFPAECPGCLLETGVPTAKEPLLLVHFADGRVQRVPFSTILPPGPSVRLLAFTAAFDDDRIAADPDAVAWLRTRTASQFPGRPVSGIDIVWRRATYRAADPSATQYAPLETIHVPFDGPAPRAAR